MKWRVNNNDIDGQATADLLARIDWEYYHTDPNYEGGLSFFDRLKNKVGHFIPAWNVEAAKDSVRNAEDPELAYEEIVEEILSNQNIIDYYGV